MKSVTLLHEECNIAACCSGHTASVVNSDMILWGGEDDRHWPFKDMYVLNLTSLTWQQVCHALCAMHF